jgi:methionyl-tRNA formyltransferase
MDKEIRIVYMGTPQFAVEPLKAILAQGYDVAAVVTSPDKPAGRGLQLQQSAVKQFAVANGLPVLQPLSLKDLLFIEQLRSLKANLQVVVAFRMLPEVVWTMPELGTFNLHASLLPQYRGAAPINHAIINGEKETGITTFMLKHEIDTGDILLSEKYPIYPDDTAGDLHDRLMVAGAGLVIRTIEGIQNGSLKPLVQSFAEKPGEILQTAPKILKEHCLIDWDKPAEVVRNLIRGLSPVPGAFTLLESPAGVKMNLKAFKAHTESSPISAHPGTIQTDSVKELKISCRDAWLMLDELQLQGKKRMKTDELLRGFRIDNSWKTCDFIEKIG